MPAGNWENPHLSIRRYLVTEGKKVHQVGFQVCRPHKYRVEYHLNYSHMIMQSSIFSSSDIVMNVAQLADMQWQCLAMWLSQDNPRTTGVTSAFQDTLLKGYWGIRKSQDNPGTASVTLAFWIPCMLEGC